MPGANAFPGTPAWLTSPAAKEDARCAAPRLLGLEVRKVKRARFELLGLRYIRPADSVAPAGRKKPADQP